MERYAKNFKAMSEAIPLLEEILGIYQHAINIQQAQKPTQKQIHETRDRMVKVSKSAQKIVEKLERKNTEIIQNPTEEKIEKAAVLLRNYKVLELDFNAMSKGLEKFGITFNVDFPSIPILQNSIKKAGYDSKSPSLEKKRTEILSKFKLRG